VETHPCPICHQACAPTQNEIGGFRLYACARCGLRFAPEAFDKQPDYDTLYEGNDYDETHVQAVKTV